MKRVTSALITFFIFLNVPASSCATDPYESTWPISDKIFASEKPTLGFVKEQVFPYIDVEHGEIRGRPISLERRLRQ